MYLLFKKKRISKIRQLAEPSIMLLIGIKANLIRYPITPITARPIMQAFSIFMYSNKYINTYFNRLMIKIPSFPGFEQIERNLFDCLKKSLSYPPTVLSLDFEFMFYLSIFK